MTETRSPLSGPGASADMGKPARGMGSYEIRRSTRRARLSASEGTGPALFQVEPLNSAKGVRIMANGEKKADVARAIIAHALNVTADCLAEQPQRVRPGQGKSTAAAATSTQIPGTTTCGPRILGACYLQRQL